MFKSKFRLNSTAMMDPSFDPNDRKEKGEFTFSLNLKTF